MTDRRGTEFADIVYTVLVAEKGWAMEDIANQMGMKYATLYARVHQRVPFSADEIRDLIRVAPDIRLATYFLEGTAFIATDRGEEAGAPADTIHRGATCSVLEATDVLRVVEEGLEDEKLDHRDKLRIEEEIRDAEQALSALRIRLNQD